jgi:hypothetical protein
LITLGDYKKYKKGLIDWEVVHNNPGGDFRVSKAIPHRKPTTTVGVMDNPSAYKNMRIKKINNMNI